MRYPNLHATVKQRTRFLYGSMSYLATQTGLSRQTLHARIVDAQERQVIHPYLEFLLFLRAGSLAADDLTPQELTHFPEPSELAYRISNAETAWKNRRWNLAARQPARSSQE